MSVEKQIVLPKKSRQGCHVGSKSFFPKEKQAVAFTLTACLQKF
jgi:hypothetical protein